MAPARFKVTKLFNTENFIFLAEMNQFEWIFNLTTSKFENFFFEIWCVAFPLQTFRLQSFFRGRLLFPPISAEGERLSEGER